MNLRYRHNEPVRKPVLKKHQTEEPQRRRGTRGEEGQPGQSTTHPPDQNRASHRHTVQAQWSLRYAQFWAGEGLRFFRRRVQTHRNIFQIPKFQTIRKSNDSVQKASKTRNHMFHETASAKNVQLTCVKSARVTFSF